MNAPLPPQALEAEESTLGAMMLDVRAIDAISEIGLSGRDFYRPSHGVIYDACLELYATDKPVDAITVVDKLAEQGRLKDVQGGGATVNELAALVPSALNAAHYARIVKDHAIYRRLIAAGESIRQLGYEREGEVSELIDQAEQAVFDLALAGRAGDFVALAEPLAETFRRIEEIQAAGAKIVGLPSGFGKLDHLTSGFEPGNLIVLAARPSMGKTGLALNIAANVALGQGKPVGLFTLEMSRTEVTQRMLSSEALVDSSKIRNGRALGDDWTKLLAAAGRLHTAPLQIDDSGTLTSMEIRAKSRRLKLRFPDLALIIVDYLQLMTSGQKSDNRVQDVSQISRGLKVLAADVGVPVIALSQLSRGVEQRHDKRPILSDLRESGSIEQDADIVMFIYRDEYYNPDDTDQEGIAEVSLAKHRNGPTGMVKLAFVSRYTRFADLAHEPDGG